MSHSADMLRVEALMDVNIRFLSVSLLFDCMGDDAPWPAFMKLVYRELHVK